MTIHDVIANPEYEGGFGYAGESLESAYEAYLDILAEDYARRDYDDATETLAHVRYQMHTLRLSIPEWTDAIENAYHAMKERG